MNQLHTQGALPPGRDPGTHRLGQGRRTYGARDHKGTRKYFLSTRHLPLSNFCYLFCPTRVSILRTTCVYIALHISDCVQIVYELPLLPNNTASETFLHKSGALRSVHWIFIIGVPPWRWLGEYVTLNKTFYNLLFKHEAAASQVIFPPLSHSSNRPLL